LLTIYFNLLVLLLFMLLFIFQLGLNLLFVGGIVSSSIHRSYIYCLSFIQQHRRNPQDVQNILGQNGRLLARKYQRKDLKS